MDKCTYLDSAKKPLWLAFKNEEDPEKDVLVIFKNGDGKVQSAHAFFQSIETTLLSLNCDGRDGRVVRSLYPCSKCRTLITSHQVRGESLPALCNSRHKREKESRGVVIPKGRTARLVYIFSTPFIRPFALCA